MGHNGQPPTITTPATTNEQSSPYGLGTYGDQYVRGAKQLLGYSGKHQQKPITANEAFVSFRQLAQVNPDAYKAIQQQMFDAGLYSKNYMVQFGLYSKADGDAFAKILKAVASNQKGGGYQLPDYLSQIQAAGLINQQIAAAMKAASRAASRPPLVINQTDPNTIKQVLRATAPDVIGRSLSDAEMNQLVAAYHGAESSYQRGAYNAQASGGTVTEPPNLQAFAAQKAKELHPQDFDQYQKFEASGFLSKLFGPVRED